VKKQPLFCLFVVLSLGIAVADIFPINFKCILVTLFFCIAILVVSYFVEKLRTISIVIFFFLLGFSYHSYDVHKDDFVDLNYKRNIVFHIVKKLNSTEKNTRYIVEITNINEEKDINTPIYAVFSLTKQNPTLDFTMRYYGEYFINKISPSQNAYQFDYQKHMLRSGVAYQIYSNEMPKSVAKEASLADKIKQGRLNVLQSIDGSALSSKSKNFLKGIILADRTDMDSDITRDFTKSGLVHLLAISGTHMAIIFLIFIKIIKFILPFRLRKMAIILSLIFIWGYSVFIDYGNSVVRACLMLSIYYGTIILQRKPDLLHSMGIAGLVILIWDTQQLFNVGFQLSFLAVFGIYWLNKPILKLFPKTENNVYNFIQNIISVTISAQIITLPIILYYFHQFSFISIISNIIVIPFAQIIIIFSLFVTIILSLGINLQILSFIYDKIIGILLKLIHFFAEVDFLFFDDIQISIYEVISIFTVIYFLRYLLISKNLKIFIRFGFSLLMFLFLRLGLDFYYFYKEEFLEHSYHDKSIFSIKRNSHVVFYLPSGLDKNIVEKYLMKPYVLHSRSASYEVSEFDGSEITGFRYKDELKATR